MLRTLPFLVVLVGLCRGTHIQYPVSASPCILLDVTANNTLVWTNKDGQKTMAPMWSFADGNVHNGACGTSPFLELRWPDSRSFKYTFSNVGGAVELTMQLGIIPNYIAAFSKSTDADPISAKQTIQLGSPEKSYLCNDLETIKLEMNGGDGNKYEAELHFTTLKAQAFNVENGNYSEVEMCNAVTTAEPVTTQPPKPVTTPEKLTTEPAQPVTTPEGKTTEPPQPPTSPEVPTKEPTTEPQPSPTEPVTSEAPTTEPPAPVTTKPVTTPPAPTTVPPFTPGNHPKQTLRVDSGDNNCVYMVGEFLFAVPYDKDDNTTGTASVGLQEVKSVTGNCNGTGFTNTMNVKFHDDWIMDITISSAASQMLGDDDSNKFWWSLVNLTYVYKKDSMPGLKPAMEGQSGSASTNQTLFKASKDSSYLCNSETSVQLSSSVSMTTYNLQYNAFHTGKNQTKFDGDPTQCSADEKTNSIVPIAVGAALAGLVVIVLIAYLIGRRRNRKGYESV